MHLEKIKEKLSEVFVKAIWSYGGYNFAKPEEDLWVDLTIRQTSVRNFWWSSRYHETWKSIDLQLKATTINSSWIEYLEDWTIKYVFEVKNYNDIIQRIRDWVPTPLILILFILPWDQTERLDLSLDWLFVKKEAYRYKPNITEFTENSSSITVTIPVCNRLTLETFDTIFESFT